MRTDAPGCCYQPLLKANAEAADRSPSRIADVLCDLMRRGQMELRTGGPELRAPRPRPRRPPFIFKPLFFSLAQELQPPQVPTVTRRNIGRPDAPMPGICLQNGPSGDGSLPGSWPLSGLVKWNTHPHQRGHCAFVCFWTPALRFSDGCGRS